MSDSIPARSMFRSLSAAALVSLAGTARADVQPDAGMLRYPDVSADKVCFVYGNDIWVAPKGGGLASPLTTPPGVEGFPRFSADGQTIAFVGNYDGNRDLYTMPASGGLPTRVTHHPGGETLSDWTPDGKLMFFTNGLAGLQRQTQVFTVDAKGGMPEKLPVPYGAFGAISPDGTYLAYTPHTTDTRTWKRYRGGMATDVWLFNLKDKSAKRITDWEGTDTQAMWAPGGGGKALYYLSDNGPEHRLNIWKYDVASGGREQVTKHTDDDVKWPSMGPGSGGRGEIIFQLGSELRLLDVGTGKESVIKLTIPGDRPTVRTRSVDAAKNINAGSISPSGKRVVVEARGDLFSAPAKEGVTRNLTGTDGVFERDPAWSPDGKWIAYFSDESGEYELWVRASDARLPEEKADEKKDGADAKADEAKKDEEKKKAEARKAEPKAPPRKLTTLGAGFRSDPQWSPDSTMIVFHDQGGRMYLCTVETGETKLIDTDPWSNGPQKSWSGDSRWLVYSLADYDSGQTCLWMYNAKTGQKTRVTDPFFASGTPAFDRKGEYLYFSSNREVTSPMYSDLDTTFIYAGTQRLYMVPLRADVKSPWLAKSDEEELKKETPRKDEKKDEKKDDAKKEGDKPAEKSDKPAGEQAVADDGVSGTWSGTATGTGENFPPGGVAFTLNIRVSPDGKVSGSIASVMGVGQISSGTYDKSSGQLTLTITVGDGSVSFTGTVKAGEGSGTWSAGNANGTWTAKRTGSGSGGDDKAGEAKKDEPPKEVKIDLDGFERRAIALPIGAGTFGQIAVTDDAKLIYTRIPARGAGEPPSIKIFDPRDDTKEEKLVTAGAGGFQLSPDGKKLLVFRGGAMNVMDASAGGGKSTIVPTTGMSKVVNPRHEWRQILTDTWRLERDYFYEPTMHGVDWPKMRDHYMKMLDDCVSREDVAYVQGELISELNVGHAYITSPGDVEQSVAPVNVGLLGCDFELVKEGGAGAYKISRIYEGAPWDADARGPLSQPGVDVKVGEFLLAVNGVAVDTSKDPWAALIGTADQPTSLTIGTTPSMNDKTREVLVKPIGSEAGLRYRAWVEHNRQYIDAKTGGKVGYIYVPSTGVDGQNELFRQYFGQRAKAGLIIDDRWNSGGQIPSRFIELLNRPVTNYWAKRDGHDWIWPPDAAPGAKVMLMNGLAGSGGDCFPWFFRENKLGTLVGMRTWGGLVGISGNPGLIDGGAISVPTFGFYKNNGTWAVEGHGVDPDIEVIDDPSKMVDGGDPQMDAAIAQVLSDIQTHPYVAPKRPASPNRSGMGIPVEQR